MLIAQIGGILLGSGCGVVEPLGWIKTLGVPANVQLAIGLTFRTIALQLQVIGGGDAFH